MVQCVCVRVWFSLWTITLFCLRKQEKMLHRKELKDPFVGTGPRATGVGCLSPSHPHQGPAGGVGGGYFQIICSYHQTSGYASIRKKGHFRPWDLSAGFPKPCLSLLFPNAQRLLMPQDIILWWIPSPRLGLMPSCQAHKHSIPRVWSTFMRGNQGTAKHSWDTHNSPCLWSCK